MPLGSRWVSNIYITRCNSWSQLVGVAARGSENQLPAEGLGPQDPRLSSPAEWGSSSAKGRGTWGQYVAVCSVSNSPLTHNPFVTLSNKMWKVYFSEEVCSFVIIVDYVSACICIRIFVSRLYKITSLQRSSRCILQPQPTGQRLFSVIYLGHSLEDSYPSAEKQSVYSTAPAEWAKRERERERERERDGQVL